MRDISIILGFFHNLSMLSTTLRTSSRAWWFEKTHECIRATTTPFECTRREYRRDRRGRTFIFRQRRSARRAFTFGTPYVNYCRYANVSFCFIFYPLHPAVIGNHWITIHDRFADEGGGAGQALSPMNKRGNRAGARCKFITRVCRAFVRVRLFVKSNQILSSAHSRRFYKRSIAEADRGTAMSPSVRVSYRRYSFVCI